MSTETVAQTPTTEEDNLVNVETTPVEENQNITLQDAVVQLEKLYTEKEIEVKTAHEEALQAQLILSKKEREALQLLRQLTPLQNRFLLNALESTKKELDSVKGISPTTASE